MKPKDSFDITYQDINIVHRLCRKSPAIKPIIVRFTSYRKKREFYQGRSNLKETTITDINELVQHNVQARIYIDENRTQRRPEKCEKRKR